VGLGLGLEHERGHARAHETADEPADEPAHAPRLRAARARWRRRGPGRLELDVELGFGLDSGH